MVAFMATEFTLRHHLNLSAADFWAKVFFDNTFSERIYRDGLGFRHYELQEETRFEDGRMTRVVVTEPEAKLPGPVRSVLGETIRYVEKGSYTPEDKHYRFTVEPPKLANKIELQGELWVEAIDDKSIYRVFSMRCDVKVFGVGKLVEGAIEKTTRESNDKAAAYINQAIADGRL